MDSELRLVIGQEQFGAGCQTGRDEEDNGEVRALKSACWAKNAG